MQLDIKLQYSGQNQNKNQNQNNLYSTHVVAVQTKYYCTVLNMEIVYENMKIIHCMT